jgi:hypothetical protein
MRQLQELKKLRKTSASFPTMHKPKASVLTLEPFERIETLKPMLLLMRRHVLRVAKAIMTNM